MASGAKVGSLCYLLDIFRAQIGFPEQVNTIIREHKKWRYQKIGIEKNSYQWALGQTLWEKWLPIVGVPVNGDKVYRATMVLPHFESGRIRLRGVLDAGTLVAHPSMLPFIHESADFPFGLHDDVVDAVVGLVTLMFNEEMVMTQGLIMHRTDSIPVLKHAGRQRRGSQFDVFPSPY